MNPTEPLIPTASPSMERPANQDVVTALSTHRLYALSEGDAYTMFTKSSRPFRGGKAMPRERDPGA